MKRVHIAAVLLLACCFVASGAYAQEQGRAKARSGPRAGGAARTPREGGRPAVTGRVVYVNAVAQTMTLRTGANTVTFDAANPTLSGFRSLAEIRTGDWVAVSYTGWGITIRKGKGQAESTVRTSSGSPFIIDEAPAKKQKQKQARAAAVMPRGRQQKGESFDDVDVNKDGKITPVELSTLIKNITMDMFRQYDRNGDGFIDRTEFTDAARQQRN